ncbi:type VI secretion system lipoprotein TssJ [Desulfothermus okinawensis JCM 13304]
MRFRSIIFFFPLFFIISCGSNAKNLREPKWVYGSRAIEIHYKADNKLNFFNNNPHTLVLKVFQLKDISNFKDLIQNKDGILRLLQYLGQTGFLGKAESDLLGYKEFIIEPGEEKIIYLDRAEGARWIGVVAGYYILSPDNCSRVFKIPLIYKKKGLLFKKTSVSIGKLFVNLMLGPTGIQQIGG